MRAAEPPEGDPRPGRHQTTTKPARMSADLLLTLPHRLSLGRHRPCALLWSRPKAQRIVSLVRAQAFSSPRSPSSSPPMTARSSATPFGAWPAPFGISFVADIWPPPWCSSPASWPSPSASTASPATQSARAGPLPPALPGAPPRRHRRLPHRRHLQPLRLVRGMRSRPSASWRSAAERRSSTPRQVRDAQPRGHHPLPDGHRLPLRRHRHPQHGRPRPRAADAREPGTGDDARHPLPRRLRLQIRRVPALLLAARRLPHGIGPHRRDLRGPPHQGRGLRPHPQLHPPLRRRYGLHRPIVATIAGFTMGDGVLGAAAHFDIRRILSFHIISQIGYMLFRHRHRHNRSPSRGRSST